MAAPTQPSPSSGYLTAIGAELATLRNGLARIDALLAQLTAAPPVTQPPVVQPPVTTPPPPPGPEHPKPPTTPPVVPPVVTPPTPPAPPAPPVTTQPPATTPSATSGKVFPIHSRAFWSDDYARGFDPAKYAPDISFANLVSADPRTTFNGKPTLYLHYPNGMENAPQLGIWFNRVVPKIAPTLRNEWTQRVQKFDRFTTVGDGTTTGNGGVRIKSAASFKEGPFYLNADVSGTGGGNGRSGLEFTNVSEYVLALDSGLDPGHEHDNQARASGAALEWNSPEFWEIVTHQWLDPSDPRTARLKMWRRPVSSSAWTVVLSCSKALSATAQGATWPPMTGVWLSKNYNEKRVSDMGKWLAQAQVIDGAVVADPFGLGPA